MNSLKMTMMRPLRALGVVLQKSVYDGGTRAALPASIIMGGRYRFYSSSVTRDSPIKTAPERPRLVDMRFGQKIAGAFTEYEMQRRLGNLRAYMSDNGIGGVIFTSYHNCLYYSGFLYTSFGRQYGVGVTLDDCVTLSAGIDGGQPWRRSYGDSLTYTDWHQDNFFYGVRKVMSDVPGKIAIEFDQVTMENWRKFEDALPFKIMVDIGEPTMYMRTIKSKEEIDLIRQGAYIADLGGYAAIDALQQGAVEYEIARHATSTMVQQISQEFPSSELMDTWTWFQSGINTDGAHNPLTSRRIKNGDILSLNCFPCISGYYTALERTLFLDHIPSQRHLDLWEINCSVHRRGLELIRPGIRCCDIAAELNEIYMENDLLENRTFGYGHSFGSLCHYYGREKALEIREDIDTKLEPGMVVSMEPMIMIPEGQPGAGGYREHDILVVTHNGAENITGFPYGPEHLVIQK